MSLFGDLEDNEIEIQHPLPAAEFDRWSTLERLSKEKDLVGLYLSAHPLDEYKYELLYGCNTTLAELESIPNPRGREEKAAKLEELSKNPQEMERIQKFMGREISCGGLVTAWREGNSKKNGEPYGILTLEDYSGKHDFLFFGAAFPQWRGFGKEGMYLFIQAKYQPSRFLYGRPPHNIFDYDFTIGSIKQLNEVSENLLESLVVMLDCHKLSGANILQMADVIIHRSLDEGDKQNEKTPKTSLYFELFDPNRGYAVKLYSRKFRVRITHNLIEFLRSLDGVQLRINNRLVEDMQQQETDEEIMEEEEMLPDD